jgi:transcriptional regulator GlxA family with amidase domain
LTARLFVHDGNIWSSAGVSAGIDLALHLVEADHGRKLAMDVAKMLVVYFRRPGNQHQFSTNLSLQASSDTDFSDLLTWAAAHLKENLSVEVLADRAGMSVRSFTRKFRAAVGLPPAAAIGLVVAWNKEDPTSIRDGIIDIARSSPRGET